MAIWGISSTASEPVRYACDRRQHFTLYLWDVCSEEGPSWRKAELQLGQGGERLTATWCIFGGRLEMGDRREKFISIHLPLESVETTTTHTSLQMNTYSLGMFKSGKQIWNVDEMETFSQHTNGSHCHSIYCDMTHARKLIFVWKRKETEGTTSPSECLICQSGGGEAMILRL